MMTNPSVADLLTELGAASPHEVSVGERGGRYVAGRRGVEVAVDVDTARTLRRLGAIWVGLRERDPL